MWLTKLGDKQTSRREVLLWGGGATVAAALGVFSADMVARVLNLWIPTVPTVDFVKRDGEMGSLHASAPDASEVPYREEVWDLSMSSLRWNDPLKRHGVRHTPGAFFGWGQWRYILREYNPQIPENPAAKLTGFRFPLVYPELRNDFPRTLEELLLTRTDLGASIWNARTILIATKTQSGKHALVFYQDGILRLATHIASGLASSSYINKKTGEEVSGWVDTPEGTYMLGQKYIFRTSEEFNAPMPYAMHIDGMVGEDYQWIFLHGRNQTNGKKESHGCVGLPHAYIMALHEIVPNGIPVVIAFETIVPQLIAQQ